jgi:hypothetical protein
VLKQWGGTALASRATFALTFSKVFKAFQVFHTARFKPYAARDNLKNL